MTNNYGYISHQGEYILYSMPVWGWIVDMSRRKDTKKSIAPSIDPDLKILTDENVEDWIEARSDYQVDADTVRDEIIDQGGDIKEVKSLLPGMWLNVDDKELYVVDRIAGDFNLENYLSLGWSFISLTSISELADYLPESMVYWVIDEPLDFEGVDAAYGYTVEDDDDLFSYGSDRDVSIGNGFSEEQVPDEFEDSEI